MGILAPSFVGHDRRRCGTEMPNMRDGGAADAAATSGRQMPMLADATRAAVVGAVGGGMVDANELLSALGGLWNLGGLDRTRGRQPFVGGAVALAALLLDKL